jgi:hypothetical protein
MQMLLGHKLAGESDMKSRMLILAGALLWGVSLSAQAIPSLSFVSSGGWEIQDNEGISATNNIAETLVLGEAGIDTTQMPEDDALVTTSGIFIKFKNLTLADPQESTIYGPLTSFSFAGFVDGGFQIIYVDSNNAETTLLTADISGGQLNTISGFNTGLVNVPNTAINLSDVTVNNAIDSSILAAFDDGSGNGDGILTISLEEAPLTDLAALIEGGGTNRGDVVASGSYSGTSAVPEPTVAALLGVGLLALFGVSRLRSRRREPETGINESLQLS